MPTQDPATSKKPAAGEDAQIDELAALLPGPDTRAPLKRLPFRKGRPSSDQIPDSVFDDLAKETDQLFPIYEPTGLEKASISATNALGDLAKAPELAGKFAEFIGVPPGLIERHLPFVKALADKGRELQEIGRQAEDQRFAAQDIGSQLARAAGSMLPFAAAGPAAGTFGVMLTGAAQTAVPMFEDVLANTGDERKAWAAAAIGLGLGATEALGVGGVLAKLDKASAGTFRKALLAVATSASEEALQEWFQRGGQDIATKALSGQDIKYLQTLESAGKAGLVGGILGGVVSGVQAGGAHIAETGGAAQQPGEQGELTPMDLFTQDVQQAGDFSRPEGLQFGTTEAGKRVPLLQGLREQPAAASEPASSGVPGTVSEPSAAGAQTTEGPQKAHGGTTEGPVTPDEAARAILAHQYVPHEELTPEVIKAAVELRHAPQTAPGSIEPTPGGEAQAEPVKEAVQGDADTATEPGATPKVYAHTEEPASNSSVQPGDKLGQVETVAISDLREFNPNKKTTEASVVDIARRMQAGEELPPVIASRDAKGELLIDDGSHRIEAARRLGYSDVPVRIVEARDGPKPTAPEQPRAARTADVVHAIRTFIQHFESANVHAEDIGDVEPLQLARRVMAQREDAGVTPNAADAMLKELADAYALNQGSSGSKRMAASSELMHNVLRKAKATLAKVERMAARTPAEERRAPATTTEVPKQAEVVVPPETPAPAKGINSPEAKAKRAARLGTLEPWQMSRAQWEAAYDKARAETFGSSPRKASPKAETARLEEGQRLRYGLDRVTDPESDDYGPVTHEKVVAKALGEGKPVPPSVLAEYPDLTKPAAPAPNVPEAPESSTPAAEPAREPPKTTSIKNAVVDRELADMGLPPAQHGEGVADVERHAQAMEKLKADPQAGARLVDALEANPRAPSGDEGALLALEVNRLIVERDAAQDAFNVDPSPENQARIDSAVASYSRTADVVTRAGTESSASLRIRKMMIARDYSLAEMERSLRVAKGGEPLTPDESARVRELHDKLEAASRAHEAYATAAEARRAEMEAELAMLRLKQQAKQPSRGTRRAAAIAESRARIDELVNELAKHAGRARAGLDTDTLALAVKLAVEHLKIGYHEFAAWAEEMVARIGEHIRPYLQRAWDEAKVAYTKELAQPITERLAGGESITELGPSVQRLAEHFVGHGITDREKLIDAVHGVLKEAAPDITRRQTMDAISGYGDFKQLSKDEVKTTLRDLKGQMQQVAKIEELEAGIPPKKTGVEHRAPTNAERQLIQRVNDLKRRLGVRTTDPETQLRSALDQTKTRLRNQISDLQSQIDARTPIVRTKSPSPTDAEVAELTTRRDALRGQFDALFPKQPMPDARRVELATKAVEKSIADLERRIATGDLSPKTPQAGPTSATLDAALARRDALQAELELLRDAAKPALTDAEKAAKAERTALKSYKTRKANEIARLKERTAAGEFSTPKKAPLALDKEALALKTEHEAVRRQFEVQKERHRLRNRTRTQKALDLAKEAVNLPKAIMTAWDFSAVLRQGGFFSVSHPLDTLRTHIPRMLKATLSDRGALEVDVMLRNRPLYAFGEASKLELTRHGDDIGPKEEAIRSRFSDYIPGLKASNRAFVTFLNSQRAFMFDSMVSGLPGTPTMEEGRAIANFVNIATGRGNPGKFGGAISALSVPLWSPRLLLSRLQLLVGQPLYGGDIHTRTKIAGQYARYLIGMAGVYAAAKLAGTAFEDDKDKPTIETDPRSSDWRKIKIGDTRIDPLSGLSQITVLAWRLITGETKKASGGIVPLRGNVPYGSDTSADVIGRFLRSKLSPTIGTPIDILSGENAVGEPVTPESAAKGLLVPLSFQDIQKAMQERGVPAGAALGILSIFGAGLQTYAPYTPKPRHHHK